MKYLLLVLLLSGCSTEMVVKEKKNDPIVKRDTLETMYFDRFNDRGYESNSPRTCYYKSVNGTTHQLDIPRNKKYKNKIYVQTLTKEREDGVTYRQSVVE